MWSAHTEPLDDDKGLKTRIRRSGATLTWEQVVEHWCENEEFRAFFDSLLSNSRWRACFWETPPVTTGNFDRAFEFVLVDSPALAAMRPDPAAFSEHFPSDPAVEIATFPNLGGDAWLVAPRPRGPLPAYPHLLAFSRTAPFGQRHALWRAVGNVLLDRLGPDPLWVSTSGLGVPWLHVRIDTVPKYYQYTPYRLDTAPS